MPQRDFAARGEHGSQPVRRKEFLRSGRLARISLGNIPFTASHGQLKQFMCNRIVFPEYVRDQSTKIGITKIGIILRRTHDCTCALPGRREDFKFGLYVNILRKNLRLRYFYFGHERADRVAAMVAHSHFENVLAGGQADRLTVAQTVGHYLLIGLGF